MHLRNLVTGNPGINTADDYSEVSSNLGSFWNHGSQIYSGETKKRLPDHFFVCFDLCGRGMTDRQSQTLTDSQSSSLQHQLSELENYTVKSDVLI